MYVSTPQNQVIALDAKTGDRALALRASCRRNCSSSIRPTAASRSMATRSNGDARRLRRGARGGRRRRGLGQVRRRLRRRLLHDPLAAGGEGQGHRRRLGRRVRHTRLHRRPRCRDRRRRPGRPTPFPARASRATRPGRATPGRPAARSVWIRATTTPRRNLAYFGTGNGGPWMPDTRPGDNLYSTSVVAIDVETGAIKGHHQYHWNDAWDWDEVSAPLLIDIERDGRTVRASVHAGRNGYLWILERTPEGPIKFVEAQPYVQPERVHRDRSRRPAARATTRRRTPGTNKKVDVLPVPLGRQGLAAGGLQSRTPGCSTSRPTTICCSELGGVALDAARAGRALHRHPDRGGPVRACGCTTASTRASRCEIGQLQAWDMKTGQEGLGARLRGHASSGGRC